jgi:hypothetical protein
MAGFAERRRGLVDAGFRTFGAAATWGDKPVTVRRKARDEDDRFSKVSIVTRSIILRVRSWEIDQPIVGTEVTIGAERFRIKPKPMVDAKGVWDCPAEPIDA